MMHSQGLPVKWLPDQELAVNHPSQFILFIAILLVISFSIFMVMASKSRRTKKVQQKHFDMQAVSGKTHEVSKMLSRRLTSPLLDEEFGCPSTSAGSGSDACPDEEDEDFEFDWALDPFSDKMPESPASCKNENVNNQDMLSICSLERGSKVGANPFEDDLPVISIIKGKAE